MMQKMLDAFRQAYPPNRWLIHEDAWDPKRQKMRETQFTLGNGNFCCRGVLEEIPYDSTPGTFIAGLFDRTGAQITELVNCPNPLNLRIDASGEKLDVIAMDVLHHERTLDMQHGILSRQTVFQTTHKKRILYQSRRLISMHHKHLGMMEVHITPLDADMTFTAQTRTDTTVFNRGVLTEGRKIHFQPSDVSESDDISYLCVETFEDQTLIAYASSLEVCRGKQCRQTSKRSLKLQVHKGRTLTFRKYFTLFTSRQVSRKKIKGEAIRALRKALRAGPKRLLEEHAHAWNRKWKNANIDIDGDHAADQALRFNLYHLIIAGSEDNDQVSIGARTLSGDGYRGHVFWDSELFIVPFFIYAFPEIARNQLLYRYHRLNAARSNAAAKGYRGALFPWESADTGEECTPSWAKDYDGTIIRITTLDYEHHIVADIAYAVDHYVKATGDIAFLWKYGLEMIFETARFWESRVHLNAKQHRYEIANAMGPDEFHECVKNSAYTNALARWNLQTAAELYRWAQEHSSRRLQTLARRLSLTEREVKKWQQVASHIFIPVHAKKRLIEQFEGYFKLQDPRITQLDEHFMPLIPCSVDWRSIDTTQLVKQADVVMLLYLLGDLFSLEEKRRNYAYYERRTLHKSSLSPAIHSVVGLEVGDEEKAIHYFAHALSTDLSNIHGNSDEGIHAASCGGTWQAAIMGFAGMRIHGDLIAFTPHLPPTWKALRFAVWYKGARLRICMKHRETEILVEHAPKGCHLTASVAGETKPLRTHTFVAFNTAAKVKAVPRGKRHQRSQRGGRA